MNQDHDGGGVGTGGNPEPDEPEEFTLEAELAEVIRLDDHRRETKLVVGGFDGAPGRMELHELGVDDPYTVVERPDIALDAYTVFKDAVEGVGGEMQGVTDLGGGVSVVDEPGKPLYVIPTDAPEA